MRLYEINKKVKSKGNDNYLLLTDFHGSIDLELVNEITNKDCNYIVITGDLIGGYQWESERKLDEIKSFLQIISNNHPVIIALRDKDLMSLTKKGFDNFKQLGLINNVYPIYNESIILKNNKNKIDQDGLLSNISVQKIGVSEYSSYTNNLLNSKSSKKQTMYSSIINAYDLVETGHFNNEQELDKLNISESIKKHLSRDVIFIFDDGYYLILPDNKIFYYDIVNDVYIKSNKQSLRKKLEEKNVPAIIVNGSNVDNIKLPILYNYFISDINNNVVNVYAPTRIKKLG